MYKPAMAMLDEPVSIKNSSFKYSDDKNNDLLAQNCFVFFFIYVSKATYHLSYYTQ